MAAASAVSASRKTRIASPLGVRAGEGIFFRAASRSTDSPVTNVSTSRAASLSRPSSPESSSAQRTPAIRSRITIGTSSVRAGA